ncbi:hypothetical protein PVAG01_01772 [Phlyctema vagabunda]|uniref:Uncharacterized protein n=1 Tax=Phlyctema vagabunda TaxID=108571 RepID=A0ABR4PY22_9HELO
MTGNFTCREELFEAQTAPEYERLVNDEPRRPLTPQSLAEFTKILLQENMPRDADDVLDYVTTDQLMVVACALQSLTMTSRFNFLTEATSETILRAVARWEGLWNRVIERDRVDGRCMRGFARHSAELCWFVRTLIKVGKRGDPSSRFIQTVPTDSTKDLYEFLNKYKNMSHIEVSDSSQL